MGNNRLPFESEKNKEIKACISICLSKVFFYFLPLFPFLLVGFSFLSCSFSTYLSLFFMYLLLFSSHSNCYSLPKPLCIPNVSLINIPFFFSLGAFQSFLFINVVVPSELVFTLYPVSSERFGKVDLNGSRC